MKHLLRTTLERITGWKILKKFPRGICLSTDLNTYMPGFQPDVIFDVGANIGQSVTDFRISFPNSKIFCFEPVPDTFSELKKNCSNYKTINFYSIAFSSNPGKQLMTTKSTLSDNHLVLNDQDPKYDEFTEVEVNTIDNFTKDECIENIGFLKVDTEGLDLKVLEGAKNLLKDQRIDLIQVEAGLNIDNTRHVNLNQFTSFLNTYDYFLFGLYDQIRNWRHKKPHLRRTNAVFVSSKVSNLYTGKTDVI